MIPCRSYSFPTILFPLRKFPNSSITTAVSTSTPAAEPSISTVVHIDPVSPFSISDPVPTPTSTTYPAPTTATVVPSSSSLAKKSKQVSVRFAPQTVNTERLREINLARRQQLAADLNSRVTEPLLVYAPLASFAELLAVFLPDDEPQSAHFVDWSNHTAGADAFYFFFQDNAYIQIIFEPLPEDATPMMPHPHPLRVTFSRHHRECPKDISSSTPWPHMGWTCPSRVRQQPSY